MSESVSKKGTAIVVSAPSGGGKTTLCRRLMDELPGLSFSISHTTRAPRGQEKDGVDYHFVDESEFKALIEQDAFLEWAQVHGNYYGSSLSAAKSQLESGTNVLFDIDIQGGYQIKEKMPEALLIFIVPPSMQVLEERLRGRASDTEDVIQKRLEAARQEIEGAVGYSSWIINDDLEHALQTFAEVVTTGRVADFNKDELKKRVLGDD
jgi:guanylate kinase